MGNSYSNKHPLASLLTTVDDAAVTREDFNNDFMISQYTGVDCLQKKGFCENVDIEKWRFSICCRINYFRYPLIDIVLPPPQYLISTLRMMLSSGLT